jgi:mannose-1-phosphate guanylyltransferase
LADNRWAVVLAGGDGKRLLPFTKKLTGESTPKQFCRFFGAETLLEQTLRRLKRVVSPEHTFSVVTKAHEKFYLDRGNPSYRRGLLVQPRNRGTGAAVTYGLMRVHEIDSRAVIGFFPSHHYFADDEAFAVAVRTGFEAAESHPDSVILLGIHATQPEKGYGWIEPGEILPGTLESSLNRVRGVWEEPSEGAAIELMQRGCVWNSFIMVGSAEAFLRLMEGAAPLLLRSFQRISSVFYTQIEQATVLDLYLSLTSVSFSNVLAASLKSLAVLRSNLVGWSQVSEPDRVLSLLENGTQLAAHIPGIRGESTPALVRAGSVE